MQMYNTSRELNKQKSKYSKSVIKDINKGNGNNVKFF